MEKALWEQNFASALVFYHEEEKRDPAFVDRILAHRPDYAIWLAPILSDMPAIPTLYDAGVRLTAIVDRPHIG